MALMLFRLNPELSITQIAEEVGLHKSTFHRLLATLEDERFVERDAVTGACWLGINMLHLVYLTLEYYDFRQIKDHYLRLMCEQYCEIISLSIHNDSQVVYPNVVESNQRVKLAASIGQSLPALYPASGKAILTFSPDEVVQ